MMVTMFLDNVLPPEERSRATALYYLREADYDFSAAKEGYLRDLDWENKVRRTEQLQQEEARQEMAAANTGCLGALSALFSRSTPRQDFREMVPLAGSKQD
jgi:hypothetical protein